MISIHKPEGMKMIDLGGGNNPHPLADCNVDVRPGPRVNFACSFEEPLPITTEEWDIVYCCFALEHISWRSTGKFLRECHRICKVGGHLILVIPNTEQQMRHLLNTQDWDDAGSMLFGGQDYPENSHRSFWNPTLAVRFLTEAGFSNVQISPFGELQTDMVVTAMKSVPTIPPAPSVKDVFGDVGPVDLYTTTEETKTNVLGSNVEQVETYAAAEERRKRREALVEARKYEAGGRSLGLSQPLQVVELQEPPQNPPGSIGTVNQGEPPTHWSESVTNDPGTVSEPIYVQEVTPVELMASFKPLTKNEGREFLTANTPEYAPEKWFDHAYFDGGAKVGGYAPPGYRDFPSNEIIAREVLSRGPSSAIELGCGRGYVLKRVQDAGIEAIGTDVSKHCYMTRVADNFTPQDLTRPGEWAKYGDGLRECPFEDGEIDLCYSVSFLDHIPEHLLGRLITEMKRVSKRGLHALDFGPYDGFDKTRVTVRSKEWWQDLFRRYDYPCEVVDKREWEDLSKFPQEILSGDGRIKLNVGCAMTMFHHGWHNIDVLDLDQFAQMYGYKYLRRDVTQGLPMFGTGVVDCIYSCHSLEYLNYDDGLKFLKECRRVIRPETGAMRIIVQDAELLTRCYGHGHCWDTMVSENDFKAPPDLDEFDHVNWGCHKAKTSAGKLSALLLDGHHALYDEEILISMLEEAGWEAVRVKHREWGFNRTGCQQILKETLDMLPCLSLYVEAIPRVG